MVHQFRELLHRCVCINILVTPASSTLEPVKGMFFVEGVNPLFSLRVSPVSSIRLRIKVLSKNSSGTATVSMCVTFLFIFITKCISPDDAFLILMEYESTRFLMASRNFSSYVSVICPKRQAITTVSSYIRLSCGHWLRATCRFFLVLSFSSGLDTAFCFSLAAGDTWWTGSLSCISIASPWIIHFFKMNALQCSCWKLRKSIRWRSPEIGTKLRW